MKPGLGGVSAQGALAAASNFTISPGIKGNKPMLRSWYKPDALFPEEASQRC
jgi:hypothetical protein